MTVSELDRFAPYPLKRQRLRVVPGRGEIDLEAAERAVADLLIALGKDPDGEHLTDTPRRVARSTRCEMLRRSIAASPEDGDTVAPAVASTIGDGR